MTPPIEREAAECCFQVRSGGAPSAGLENDAGRSARSQRISDSRGVVGGRLGWLAAQPQAARRTADLRVLVLSACARVPVKA